VILGAGTAGTMMAHKLTKVLDPTQWQITLVDRDEHHIYQPGLLFVPFGMYEPDDLVRPRAALLPAQATYHGQGFKAVDPEARTVTLTTDETLSYDLLIVATGTRIVPEETQGLTGTGWFDTAFDFYSMAGAKALHDKLIWWKGGTLIVNVVDMPIKCPVAPLEFLFLADAFFKERGIRDDVRIVYATPLDAAFTKPRASAALGQILEQRGIEVVTEFNLAKVTGSSRTIEAYDGRTLDYDLLVCVPLHAGAEAIQNSKLGNDLGFVPTDKHTLQSRDYPDVFVIGDAADLPTSKAGSVAHFQAEVLTENILRHLRHEPLQPDFDGHANCFIETGHGKALLIDFNYDTEPLPGKFPLPVVGPFDLLSESHINHWGKLGFRWIYWNVLVRGEEMPLEHKMTMSGKRV
ncbi:MAG: FAD-dependent oxidoreductase, partial [Oligoflexia bacterium]|nr:FAD-dependent oxidoreductase [Oligoflexia bacterium]